MTRILGIFDGTHDAGACLIEDGTLLAASDEERFTRKKGQGGFPQHAIQACFDSTDLQMTDIDGIALAGFLHPNPGLRVLRSQQQDWNLDGQHFYAPQNRLSNWLQFKSPFPQLAPQKNAFWKGYQKGVETLLSYELRRHFSSKVPPIQLYEHHRCHAASAHFASGHPETLTIVADGIGDGLALSIWKGQENRLERCFELKYPHSLGLLYASFTGYLGYKPFRHEGKLTGLAARGNATTIPVAFPFTGPFPHRRITTSFPLYQWLKQFDGYPPADIAAWLQQGIEREMLGILRWAEIQFSSSKKPLPLALAGGLFANVSLNARLSEVYTSDIFIFPNMGDAGLATGAAYLSGAERAEWSPHKITTMYLGPQANNRSGNPTPSTSEDRDIATAISHLRRGNIVARAVGRMEYGPRALGNRSIFASARDKSTHDRLNQALQRSDFMPFAPIIRAENIEKWLSFPESAQTAMEWMTITVQAKPEFTKRCPAVVHVDGSLRPQLVWQHKHPVLWKLLQAYEEETGEPALINTSFNRHEEPIVCSESDAISTFEQTGIDALWLEGQWLQK